MKEDRFFDRLAELTAAAHDQTDRAPGRVKARLYSALMDSHASTGPLCSLSATRQAGHGLCVFERALEMLPVGDAVKSTNPCRVCHARVLGERLEPAPVFWPNCPYADFHRR